MANAVLPELWPAGVSLSTFDPSFSTANGNSGGLPREGRCLRGLSSHPLCGDHEKADHLSWRKSAIFVYISFHQISHRSRQRTGKQVVSRCTNKSRHRQTPCTPQTAPHTCLPPPASSQGKAPLAVPGLSILPHNVKGEGHATSPHEGMRQA